MDMRGQEVPFGAEIRWDVLRQMHISERSSVETTIEISHTLQTVTSVLVFFLVLSVGPLLPVWMFINSMQLILHVPLIRTSLPGIAHFFLLDHLNILRLQSFRFTQWLQEMVAKHDVKLDTDMVLNEDASYYTTLL